MIGVQHHRAASERDGKVRGRQMEVMEEALDRHAFIAAGNDEVAVPPVAVNIHDVKNDGFATNLNHRLRNTRGFLGQARAKPSRKENDFHSGLQEDMFGIVLTSQVLFMSNRDPMRDLSVFNN